MSFIRTIEFTPGIRRTFIDLGTTIGMYADTYEHYINFISLLPDNIGHDSAREIGPKSSRIYFQIFRR